MTVLLGSADMNFMFIKGVAVNKYVIEVCCTEDVEVWSQVIVDKFLKVGRCVCQSKWHYVTTLGAWTPAPQFLLFSPLSRYAFPRFFLLLVILSMVRVATQQWLSHMHVTHARVSHTWWLTCSWLITRYESIQVSLYLVSWHYLIKGINKRLFSFS